MFWSILFLRPQPFFQNASNQCTLKNKLSSSFKKLLPYEHKNIFVHSNIGVFILGAICLKIGGELSGANCPEGELSRYQNKPCRKFTYNSQSLGEVQVCMWLILVEPSQVAQLYEEAKIKYPVRTC